MLVPFRWPMKWGLASQFSEECTELHSIGEKGCRQFCVKSLEFPPNNKCFHSLSRAVKLTTLSSNTNKRRKGSELTAPFYSCIFTPITALLQYLLYLPLLAFCSITTVYRTILNFFCSELKFNQRVLL
jgi:hypothetical protein